MLTRCKNQTRRRRRKRRKHSETLTETDSERYDVDDDATDADVRNSRPREIVRLYKKHVPRSP